MRPPRHLLLRSALIAVAAVLAGPNLVAQAKDILATEKKLYSQGNEELIIRDFFQDQRDGFFVDVGCAWPVRNSTTFYLEEHLGWSGIGVDGLPDYGAWWEKARPRSKFFNFIVTDHSGPPESFYRAGWPGLSSIRKGRIFGDREVKQFEIKIPATTLNDLLTKNSVERIDLLSMDIEGAELLALAGFEIQKYAPKLVCIEVGEVARDQLLDYFKRNTYERIEKYVRHDPSNWYFTPKQQDSGKTE